MKKKGHVTVGGINFYRRLKQVVQELSTKSRTEKYKKKQLVLSPTAKENIPVEMESYKGKLSDKGTFYFKTSTYNFYKHYYFH